LFMMFMLDTRQKCRELNTKNKKNTRQKVQRVRHICRVLFL
jgi:hypothetical protein